jgi:hypothetical protein
MGVPATHASLPCLTTNDPLGCSVAVITGCLDQGSWLGPPCGLGLRPNGPCPPLLGLCQRFSRSPSNVLLYPANVVCPACSASSISLFFVLGVTKTMMPALNFSTPSWGFLPRSMLPTSFWGCSMPLTGI